MSVSGFFPKGSLLPSYNPGQNILGLLRKLGVKRHFVYSYSISLEKTWGCCYESLFLLSPFPPSSVDCVETKLECITEGGVRGSKSFDPVCSSSSFAQFSHETRAENQLSANS